MTVLAADRPLLHFSVASFTGLVRPIFTEFLDLAGSFFMALFAILQHLLMLLMGESYFSWGRGQLYHISGKDSSCRKNDG